MTKEMQKNQASDILDDVVNVLRERKQNPTEKSYTSSLFTKGTNKICEKITEEAAELVEAANESGSGAVQHLVHEAVDLLFHMQVLLVHKGLSLTEIRAEMNRRFGTSGLEEKASRNKTE